MILKAQNSAVSDEERQIKDALFNSFAYGNETVNKYYYKLAGLKNTDVLLQVIRKLGRDRSSNDKIRVTPNLIVARYFEVNRHNKYNKISEYRCHLCKGTGTIPALADVHGLIDWMSGEPVIGAVEEIAMICECEIGSLTVNQKQKRPNLTPELRREKNQYALTFQNLQKNPRLLQIACQITNQTSNQKNQVVDVQNITHHDQDLIMWNFKRWYIQKCLELAV